MYGQDPLEDMEPLELPPLDEDEACVSAGAPLEIKSARWIKQLAAGPAVEAF